MSLFKIAWRSIQQRGLASLLTMSSMALGVMMVVAVLSIHGVVTKSFQNNSSLGYNLIVGAKGGALQLTLNTVYYLSKPVENIKYDFYTEFQTQSQRDAEFQNSIKYQAHSAIWSDLQMSAALGLEMPGISQLANQVTQSAARETHLRQIDLRRDGKYGQFTALAIPVLLGDYFGHFRVVGTTPEMFGKLFYGPSSDQPYTFAQGRNFKTWSEEHGYFEAVVGSAVAREMQVKLGDQISPAHGDPEGEGHEQKFTVVGILEATATPNDRAAFVNAEGFYLMEDHAKPLEPDESTQKDTPDAPPSAPPNLAATVGERAQPLPIEQREVTAILVRTSSPMFGVSLPTVINEGPHAQCVLPIREITGLFEFIVKPIQTLLLVLTALICLVSGVSILVSIYNSMSDRRHEIAVMRALGASRGIVMSVILLESILLSLGGGLLGWVGGHALNVAASPYIEDRTGVTLKFWSFAPPPEMFESLELPVLRPIIEWMSLEFAIIPGLLILAVFVGFLPAWSAYQTDVAKSLGS
jgi:putative ABC transport system permease protein